MENAPEGRKRNRLLAILHFIVADLLVRSLRPILVIAFGAYFIKHFMPISSFFVWLVFFLSTAGVWYVVGLIKTALDKAFGASLKNKADDEVS